MSKIEQLYAEWQSLQPLKDEYQQRLNRKFMLEFNYNSNHLSGRYESQQCGAKYDEGAGSV